MYKGRCSCLHVRLALADGEAITRNTSRATGLGDMASRRHILTLERSFLHDGGRSSFQLQVAATVRDTIDATRARYIISGAVAAVPRGVRVETTSLRESESKLNWPLHAHVQVLEAYYSDGNGSI